MYLGYLIVRSGLGNQREDRSILGFMLATALILVDMNGLEQINDVEGHQAGDTALGKTK